MRLWGWLILIAILVVITILIILIVVHMSGTANIFGWLYSGVISPSPVPIIG